MAGSSNVFWNLQLLVIRKRLLIVHIVQGSLITLYETPNKVKLETGNWSRWLLYIGISSMILHPLLDTKLHILYGKKTSNWSGWLILQCATAERLGHKNVVLTVNQSSPFIQIQPPLLPCWFLPKYSKFPSFSVPFLIGLGRDYENIKISCLTNLFLYTK